MRLRLFVAPIVVAAVSAAPALSGPLPRAHNGMLTFTSAIEPTEVYIENADGTGARPLTNVPAGARFPALSPDGTKVAYSERVDRQWQLFVMNLDGSGLAQVSQGFGFNGNADWSPDGTKLAYAGIALGDSRPTLCVYDFTTGTTTRIPTGTTDEYPRWSPDGTKIAFDGAGAGNVNIYVVNADGTGLRQLTSQSGWEQEPTWSPDGTQIAYEAFPLGYADIFVMNADGTNAHDITNTPGVSNYHPSWSASGIVFVSTRDGLDSLYVMRPDGSDLRRISKGRVWESDPRWSQDGRQIVFASGRDARYQIGAYSNGAYRALTRGPGYDTDPNWSPDGKVLAYVHEPRLGTSDVYTLDMGTGKRQNLTRGRGIDSSPAFSPDGRRIAFVRFESFGYQIWVMNRDGTGQHAVTSQGSWNDHPSWSPDGQKLVYDGVHGNSRNLFVLDLRTMRTHALTRGLADDRDPAWSPNGTQIAFDAPTQDGYVKVWLINADGSHRRLVGDPTLNGETEPTWSPDGSELAWTAEDFFGHDLQVETLDLSTGVIRPATPLDWYQSTPAWQPVR